MSADEAEREDEDGTASSVSDFRSDTVTRPGAAMRRAMAEAEVGDDVLDGDPTVRRLERAAAKFLGHEGALFVPSGTMANQVAIGSWTRPGDQVVLAADAHIVLWESGAAGALHGVQTVTLPKSAGVLEVDAIREALRPPLTHCPPTTLACVEQTHGESGGRLVPLDGLRAVHEFARDAKIAVHMDGARIANAAVALGVPAAEIAACADSVSMCFSKGLGAPVGSVIAGPAEFLERARVVRKRLGGWMRQSGIVAAGALYALENHVERLADDHRLARGLAAALDAVPGLAAHPESVETNIVVVEVEPARMSVEDFLGGLAEHGVRALAMGPTAARFVTHLDVGPGDVVRAGRAAAEVL